MSQFLYKVSPPRSDLIFHPSTFWHTADWESSTTRFRAGYIEDKVLYVGDFDEVNIHLFPRVRTVRIRAIDADRSTLESCALPYVANTTAYIFCAIARRDAVESFSPTVFTFNPDGFTRVRKGEYVSWAPQRAVAWETICMADAIRRWNVEPCYVADLDTLIATIRRAGIYFDEQT